jgi:hypothetical protein
MLVALVLQTVISFTTIASGTSSRIEEPRQVVIRTADEWQTLWKSHKAEATAPAVDFAQSAVVAIFLGSRSTAGFSVKITAIRKEGDKAIVEYTEGTPRPDLMVAQVITAPFHIVKVPKDIGTVEFKKK